MDYRQPLVILPIVLDNYFFYTTTVEFVHYFTMLGLIECQKV